MIDRNDDMGVQQAIQQELQRVTGQPAFKTLLEQVHQAAKTHQNSNRKRIDSELNVLLSRTTFGVSPSDIQLAEGLGFDGYLNLQMSPENINTQALDEAIADLFPAVNMSYQELIERAQNDPMFLPTVQLIVATILRALFSPAQLQEIMVEFWSNHFHVNINENPIGVLKPVDDRENIRPHALGRFKDLLHASAKSPAMLFYLDGYTNTASGPNENYARELMELHTLGVDGGYTESDVKEVARCFTGWTVSPQADGLFVFAAVNHDFGEKTVLGQRIAAGGGISDGEAVLDILAAHPSTARFIAEKLCRRFIADVPEEDIIAAVAQTFTETDGDIKSMLDVLFHSSAFQASAQLKFKRPIEYVVSLFRSLDPIYASNTFGLIFDQIDRMNQLPFFYPAPTGYADVSSEWLNTNAMLDRWNLGLALAYDEIQQANDPMAARQLAHVSVLSFIGSARTPAEITDRVIEHVLHQAVGADERDVLIQYAAKDFHATTPLPLDVAVDRARAVLSAVLISRHFQYR